MSEENVPATEAMVAGDELVDERVRYEFAFHVLPTVAEGEVAGVFETLKNLITSKGGEVFDEEMPERIDLAYEVVKRLESKNRKFTSAYFGWVRFAADPAVLDELTSEIEARTDILRYIVIRLTKMEEAHPFRYHEAMAALKQVDTVEEQEVVKDVVEPEPESEQEEVAETETTPEEEKAEAVDEKALDEALEKKEA